MGRLINNYTVSYKDDLYRLSEFDTVQITLNYRTFPAKRKSYETFLKICDKNPSTKFICHYDFIYQPTKYLAFNPHVREAIAKEVCELLSIEAPNFVGIVMHTDTVYKKVLFSDPLAYCQIIDTSYNSKLFDLSVLKNYFSDPMALSSDSIKSMVSDICHMSGSSIRSKIYLENTVKTVIRTLDVDPVDFLSESCKSYSSFVGLCFDTEHYFATNSVDPHNSVNEFLDFSKDMPFMVHLNCIPAGVAGGSYKDRHSETTVTECSVESLDTYIQLVNKLNQLNIPYVREVKGEARDREINQLESWQTE